MINLEKLRLLNESVGNAVSLINKLKAENQNLKTQVTTLESELKDFRSETETRRSDEELAEKSLQGALDSLNSFLLTPSSSTTKEPPIVAPSKTKPSTENEHPEDIDLDAEENEAENHPSEFDIF